MNEQELLEWFDQHNPDQQDIILDEIEEIISELIEPESDAELADAAEIET